FAELMARVQRVVFEAFEHQDYPMPALVERLNPPRDPSRNPIFDVLFALRKAHLHEAERLTMLSFGGAAVEIERDGLRIRSRNIGRHCSQLDLTLGTTEFEGEIRAYWEYRTDLFEATTMEEMAEEFRTLAEGAARQPERPLSELAAAAGAGPRSRTSSGNA